MTARVNQLINRWLTTIPDADKAYRGDAAYYAHISMMRRMLSAMDLIMEGEGVPEETRVRVIRALICGAPDETDALTRMKEAEQLLQRLRSEPARLIVPWAEHTD